MISSAGRESPRVVHVCVPRRAATLVGIVALPLTLAACGMVGRDAEDKAPVVIPTVSDGDTPLDSTSPSSPAPTDDVASAAAQTPPSVTVESTVTRTGVVIQEKTRRVITTRNVVTTRTLPRVTVTVIPPPIRLTETVTETVRITAILTTRIFGGPGGNP